MVKISKKIVSVFFLSVLFFSFGLTAGVGVLARGERVFAQTTISDKGKGVLPDWGGADLETVVENRVVKGINFFIAFSALVAVGLIVVSGYLFITAQGDPEKIDKARKALTAAIVGMIIVFLARVIIGFVLDIGEGGPSIPEKKDDVRVI